MSSSVSPWLNDYLIGLAEEYGGDTSKFPETGKKKSVQLTKYIFYGSTNPKEMSPIWAQISDKVLEIPAKFSSESVAAYVQEHKSRLTQNKTCLVKLKKYKLSFGRIPIRVTSHPNSNADNLSKDPFLFLDVTAFEVMGSINEDIWCKNTLKSVEGHVEIKEWVMGLRKGGGDGNVLKLRKRELDAQRPPPPSKPQAKQTRLEMPARAEPLKPKPKPLPRTTPNEIDAKEVLESFARQRERHWNRYSKYPQNSMVPREYCADPQKLVYGDIEPEDYIDSTRETVEGSPKRKRKAHPLDLGSSQPELDPRPVQQESEKNNPQEKATRTKRSHPLDLGSSQPQPSQKEEEQSGHSNDTQPSQQATPPPSEPAHESEGGYSPAPSSEPLTTWSPTPSPTRGDVQIIEQSSPCLPVTPRSSSSSQSLSLSAAPPLASSLTAPTSAQRRRATYSSPDLSRNNYGSLHQSDHSNSSPSCVMGTYRSSALDPQMYAGMVRVVSPPPQPGRSPVNLEASPRVLVPCSDSGSQSQSQSQGSNWENQEYVAVKEENAQESILQEESQEAPHSQSSVHQQQGEKNCILPLPANTGRTIPSQEFVVPETQPNLTIHSEAEDEEVEGESLFAKTQSQALSQEQDSLEVHPGTQDGDTHSLTAQDGFGEKGAISGGSDPSQSQSDQDDAQTMQSLFGIQRAPKAPFASPAVEKQRAIHFIPHDATAWKQPAFMKRNAVASSTRPSISPLKTLPVKHQLSGKTSKAGSNCDTGSATRKMHNAEPSASALHTATSGTRRQLDTISIQQAIDVEVDVASAKARGKKRAIDDDEAVREVEGPLRKKTKVKASEVRPPCGKLSGFSLDLDNQSKSSNLVTWDRLQSILLKTGRERSKQYAREGLRR